MADDIRIGKGQAAGLDPSLTAPAQQAKTKKEIGKEEFLTLLVTQLKHQDPMDPLKNDDFAVNLAQFSQLEQLVDINNKLTDEESGAGMGSLASYLGQEVVLSSSQVSVQNGDAGNVSFHLMEPAANLTAELLNADGAVVGTAELGSFDKGPQTAALQGLNTINGEYELRLSALGARGNKFEIEGYSSGLVSGYVPGPEPMLIVNGREVSPGEVKEVRLPTSTTA